jgi:hypothetical protein
VHQLQLLQGLALVRPRLPHDYRDYPIRKSAMSVLQLWVPVAPPGSLHHLLNVLNIVKVTLPVARQLL